MSATQRRNTLTPGTSYDQRIGRYRDLRTGQLVSQQTVRTALDRVLDTAERDARAVTQRLRDRTISVKDWQREMATNIRRSQSAGAALSRGGWASMTSSDWLSVARNTKAQYRYLDRFAAGIADGSIPLDGRVLNRAQSYISAGHLQYEADARERDILLGYTEERNLQHSRDSCDGENSCTSATSLGWQAVGVITIPGQRRCKGACKCSMERRRAA